MTEQRLKNLEEYVEHPGPLLHGDVPDKIIQMFIDERYNFFVLMRSGRVFKKRARGQSGGYDLWKEISITREIEQDLHLAE